MNNICWCGSLYPMKKAIKNNKSSLKIAVLGGGCFWCLETVFLHTKGVLSVISGYAGGTVPDPAYEDVSSGRTGHAEVIKFEYDPEIIVYGDLLHIFFSIHDPTTPNRQGNDVGTQYRSIILYADNKQKKIAEKIIQELEDQKIYAGMIITELSPLKAFYPAESYHQRYFEKNPEKAYCQIVVAPKLSKFRQNYSQFHK